MLWDLAGQHVYRQVHTIFLDNVDAALVLFDPSNRQEPLKGAQFWLEQLRGKSHLPPSVLVGARSDRGAPAVTQEELAQFCQRYEVSGGFLSTSAKTGEGIDELVTLLRAQIPWAQMTTTVTTLTFKRIKDYVLGLKAQPNRQGVLVSPAVLRTQLEAGDSDWQFSDAEMMTAVGHLQNHGYVAILTSSSGEQHILLAPELLASLASSVVLLADKHPRELGALSEGDLLAGNYPFAELTGLEDTERQLLLDAAVLRFLDHSICFRETYEGDTLLIFPGLIKQKRPLEDDFPAVDDISFVVRGRVENLYAMLVVLLGYTPSFTRIHQWQNQAQYELGPGEICGFRMIADREGEIELVIYYSFAIPQRGRDLFLDLFDRFLYQRDVEVSRFPTVFCPNDHRLERATVVRRRREGKGFAFCEECGERTELPAVERQGIGTAASPWLQREEAAAHLRRLYETFLTKVKGYRRGWASPRCYLSSTPGQTDLADKLRHDLQDAGVYIVVSAAQVQSDDFVVVLDTPAFQRAWKNPTPDVVADLKLIRSRLASQQRRLISILVEGGLALASPHVLGDCKTGDLRDESHYPIALFNLVLNLYAIPFDHKGFAPLRDDLHQQWERIPQLEPGVAQSTATQMAVAPVEIESSLAEDYLDFNLHISPDGRVVASSPEGERSADISTQPPSAIEVGLPLIERNATDANFLKEFGQNLYAWLLPGPIHIHLQQTEALARAKGMGMRLRLRVEAESIAALPLELLYAEGGYYMALNPNRALSRYLNLPLPPGPVRRRQQGALHMLAIVASPSNLPPLDPNEWEQLLKEALAKPLADGRMTLTVVGHATRRQIRDALRQRSPDIIQLIGHGYYADGDGKLALVDEATGKIWPVDGEGFADLLMSSDKLPGLISLLNCESARSNNPPDFVGVAPHLIQRGIPAVLAMHYKLRIESGRIFLEDFYSAVADRRPVDWAAQSARNALAQALGRDNREFATPVLYMRAADGQVF